MPIQLAVLAAFNRLLISSDVIPGRQGRRVCASLATEPAAHRRWRAKSAGYAAMGSGGDTASPVVTNEPVAGWKFRFLDRP